MNVQLSLTLTPEVDPFDLHVAPVLTSEAFADLCRSLTKDCDIVAAVTVRAEQLRGTWDSSVTPTAWAHALAREVVIERHRTRREFEREVIPQRGNLFGAAMKLTRDPSEADDLVQDTMVRAWRFWASYEQGTNLRAWLFTILRNTFINGYHRRGRQEHGLGEVAAAVAAHGDAAALAKSVGEPETAETALDTEAMRALVHESLALLPDQYRECVTMCDLEGMHYREIAEALGIPIGTVMSRIYRGRQQMRRILGGGEAK